MVTSQTVRVPGSTQGPDDPASDELAALGAAGGEQHLGALMKLLEDPEKVLVCVPNLYQMLPISLYKTGVSFYLEVVLPALLTWKSCL